MTMQWQEELRQLAEIESPDSGAITFYFKPQIPQNLSHREEAILAKDLVENAIQRYGRNESFNGYEAGHVERHVGNGVMRYVKRIAERLLEIRTEGQMDCLVIGCRQEMWPEIEPHLHPYLKKCLIGRMTLDPAVAS